jgi:hypothetical protein
VKAAVEIVSCLVPQLLEGKLAHSVTVAFVSWWGNLPGRVSREVLPTLIVHLGLPHQVIPPVWVQVYRRALVI